MNDEQKRELLNDILARVGTNAIGQVVIEQNNTIYVDEKQPPHLPPCLVQEKAMEIYSFLVDRKFIDANTNAEHFLFLFGVKGVAPNNSLEPCCNSLLKLPWNESRCDWQTLRETCLFAS